LWARKHKSTDMDIINPFVTNGYAGEEYFCDRVEETKNMIDLLTNGNNIALISPRRVGKTDLISHCFNQKKIKDKYNTFAVDMYATSSKQEFVNVLGKSILEQLKPKGKKAWEKFLKFAKSLQSSITFDINNNPVWSVGIGNIDNTDVTLDEIFQYLENADKPCIVAVDEFQQITRYNDNNIEALLRTHIQKCRNTLFIFSGSQRHIMSEMFTSPAKPFYQSVVIMNLQKIDIEKYCDFAVEKFTEDNEKSITRDTVKTLYNKFNGITANIQRIMNIMYFRTPAGEKCDEEKIDDAVEYYLKLTSDTYQSLFSQMPEKQRQVLLAIAAEGETTNVTGSQFVKKYNLVSPSSVMSAIKGLLEKDFITKENNTYSVYDQFFLLWIKRNVIH